MTAIKQLYLFINAFNNSNVYDNDNCQTCNSKGLSKYLNSLQKFNQRNKKYFCGRPTF